MIPLSSMLPSDAYVFHGGCSRYETIKCVRGVQAILKSLLQCKRTISNRMHFTGLTAQRPASELVRICGSWYYCLNVTYYTISVMQRCHPRFQSTMLNESSYTSSLGSRDCAIPCTVARTTCAKNPHHQHHYHSRHPPSHRYICRNASRRARSRHFGDPRRSNTGRGDPG